MDVRTPLSVMTANLWNLNGPWSERMARFSDLVAQARPDVIAMQEVWPVPGSLGRLQLDLVDALAGYHLYYSIAHAWEGGAEGLAVASRVPATEVRSYRLPGSRHDFEPDRAVQYVRIPWGDTWLGVFNTHLAYHHTSEQLRLQQAEFVGELARQSAETRPSDGLVVCGDLNATPASAPLARLQSLAGLHNPWLELSADRHTFAATNPYVADDPDRDSWLDYILTRNVTTTGLRLLDDWSDAPASDHYFVQLEIDPANG